MRKGKSFDLTARYNSEDSDFIRRLRISANISFEQLHLILQYAFEWDLQRYHTFKLFNNWDDDQPEVELGKLGQGYNPWQ
jgi:hypothetical protein